MHRSTLRKPILLLALMPVLCCGIYWFTQVRDIPFESQAWRNTTRYQNVRSRMLKDLEAHHLVIGMERSQVEELLGPPEDSYSPEFVRYNVHIDVFGMPWLLKLTFDENGRLISFHEGEP